MSASIKNVFRHVIIFLIIFCIGFSLSSGIVLDCVKKISDKVVSGISERLGHHVLTLLIDAKHHYLVPEGGYKVELFWQPLSFTTTAVIMAYSIFNILFQPVFLCVFTPQVILNVVSFPFFLYGSVKYFKKVWLLLALFIAFSFQICTYDSVVEAIIRHGMICELMYLLISVAGFTSLTTKKSY